MKELLKKWFKKSFVQIIIVVVLLFVNIYMATIPPKIIGNIVDLLYDIPNTNKEIYYEILFLMLSIIGFLVTRLPWRTMAQNCILEYERMAKDFLFNHFLKIKMGNLQEIKNGEIMTYFTKDVNETRRFIGTTFNKTLRCLAILIISTYIMIKNVNLKLTLLTLLPIFVTTIIVVILKEKVERASIVARNAFSNLSEFVQESTDGIRTIKAYSGEDKQIESFDVKSKKLRNANIKVSVLSTLISTLTNISFGIGIAISILYGSKLVINKDISIGDLIAFNGYIAMFVNPIIWIPQIITKLKLFKISYNRIEEFLNLETENIRNEKVEKGKISGDILIKDLTYNYPANIEVALKNINLEIKQGETLGIIGTIGSGKTTLMNLLLRLYTVPNGKIFIGGNDINTIDLNELRDSICYITQEHFLFSTSIKENIELFRDGFSEEDILDSTKNAMISEDISRMEDGINTVVGERGIDLSGGQKQRVVISRAFLQKSNIVIFDDTFSALDNKTEESLLKNIKKLTKNKTCIIISNRISDIKDADKIIVLDDGNIIQQGVHSELIKQMGLYKKFYIQQSSKTDEEVGELIG